MRRAANERMLDRTVGPPSPEAMREWLGARAAARWGRLAAWIDEGYPGVFSPDWIYGGAKHGWALRYKKGRSFCIVVPERGRVLLVIVLGKAEREAADGILPRLAAPTRAAYRSAKTFADGKWVALPLESQAAVEDAKALLELKRRPGPRRGRARPAVPGAAEGS